MHLENDCDQMREKFWNRFEFEEKEKEQFWRFWKDLIKNNLK
jgi:hypothetical protein